MLRQLFWILLACSWSITHAADASAPTPPAASTPVASDSAKAVAATPVTLVACYRGMLGSYGKDYPFYILSIPDGSNVWGDFIKKTLNGKFDVINKAPQQFTASGKFYLPKKLKLSVEAGRAVNVTIDKLGVDLSNYGKTNSAVFELDAGLHAIKVDVINNGGQLPECSVKITDPTGKFECPIFITESDVTDFLKTLPQGANELSAWDWKKAKLDFKLTK